MDQCYPFKPCGPSNNLLVYQISPSSSSVDHNLLDSKAWVVMYSEVLHVNKCQRSFHAGRLCLVNFKLATYYKTEAFVELMCSILLHTRDYACFEFLTVTLPPPCCCNVIMLTYSVSHSQTLHPAPVMLCLKCNQLQLIAIANYHYNFTVQHIYVLFLVF